MAEARILVHGHRGARAVLPENTIPAFEYAIQAGADFIELDVGVTKDDVPVVTHDPEINPRIRPGPHAGVAIRTLTLAEVREYPGPDIPTLDEVLGLPRVQFNIELKSFPDRPELAPAPDQFALLVYQAIAKHNLDSRCIVQSFDFRILHAMKRLAPAIRIAALWVGLPRPLADIAQEAGAKIVAPEHHLVTHEAVEKAHGAHLEVVPWTANTPADWQRLIDAGVDGIITDDPAALIAYLKTQRLR